MRSEWKHKFQRFLSWEIAIEYKVCLYFACIIFFYSAWLVFNRNFYAGIRVIWEMILTAYAVGYMQVYLFRNFDEAEKIGIREGTSSVLCCMVYAGASYGLGWFDKNAVATLLFAVYMLVCYLCVFLCNKVKRDIDTRNLNRMLEFYKKGAGHE